MELFLEDLRRVPKFLVGITILTIGVLLVKRADIGMASWGVFHSGLENITGLSFGWIIQIVGLIILTGSILLVKVKVGIGTLLNLLIIGILFNVLDAVYTFIPISNLEKGVMFGIGLLLMTFGRSLYISVNLGAGPRDGLFVGLSRVTKVSVKYVKPMVEFTFLIIGFLLGAKVGVGTLIAIITSGYLVNFFFNVIGFDPRTKKQSDITEYFKQKVSSI